MLGLRFYARAFSSCGKQGPLFIAVAGLSLSLPLLLRSTGSRRAGSVVVAHGPVAPRHVVSSQTRARTRVPCISRQILNHCATREAPVLIFYLLTLLALFSCYFCHLTMLLFMNSCTSEFCPWT